MKKLSSFNVHVRVISLVSMITGMSMAVNHAESSFAAGTCIPVPYLAQGASTPIGGVTVSAVVNTANSVGGQPNYYLHQSVPASVNPALDTTWAFSPPISQIQFKTLNHGDGDEPGGGGLKENYAFTAFGVAGNVVSRFNILDEDGQFQFAFSAPVASIAVTYTPTVGIYGSFLLLGLPTAAGACGSIEASVRATDQAMRFGSIPPTLTAAVFPTGSLDPLPVTFTSLPTCSLEDAQGNAVELSSSTPVGSYSIVCSGGEADGLDFVEYVAGEFVVEPTPENPRPTFDGDFVLRSSELPDLR